MLVCTDIEYMLKDFGCKVVGPAAKVAKALALIDTERVDLAPPYDACPRLQKPFAATQLRECLAHLRSQELAAGGGK